jgi:site-specific recombinase XerD
LHLTPQTQCQPYRSGCSPISTATSTPPRTASGPTAQRATSSASAPAQQASTGATIPHRIRHSYTTDLLRRGASLETIRRVLGHSSITTTIRYLHLTGADLSEAIDCALERPDDEQAA